MKIFLFKLDTYNGINHLHPLVVMVPAMTQEEAAVKIQEATNKGDKVYLLGECTPLFDLEDGVFQTEDIARVQNATYDRERHKALLYARKTNEEAKKAKKK